MEASVYAPIRGTKKYNEIKESRKHFFRQLLICSGVWTVYFAQGLCLGAPTVFIPQLRREANSTDAVSVEMASWLSSIFGYIGIPATFILSILAKIIGRRRTFIVVSFGTIIPFIFFYFCETPTQLLIVEVSQSFIHGTSITASLIIVTEYTSPRYRGIFLTLKTATLFWGIWVSNALGTFFHWKTIPIVGFACSIYSLTVFLWPESPYWLASRGLFEQCRISHRWLKGNDDNSEKELENLIKSQHNSIVTDSGFKNSFKDVRRMFLLKEFFKPVLLSALMILQFHLSGKFVCSMYSIDIIKQITGDEKTAYIGMLILDGITVFSMYIGSFLSRYIKRRKLLFSCSALGIAFLFIISLYLYLIKLTLIVESKVLTISFLILFSISISCGPMIMATSVYGELTPLKYKSACMIIIALLFQLSQSTFLKLAPYLFQKLGLHGTFFFYGISVSACTVLLYKYLPETKDKTLQEIEEYFKDKPIVGDK